MLAWDVARGLISFTISGLRRYSADDLKVILSVLNIVQREIRAEQVPLDDALRIRDKNQRLQRLNQAVGMISAHIKQRRLRM